MRKSLKGLQRPRNSNAEDPLCSSSKDIDGNRKVGWSSERGRLSSIVYLVNHSKAWPINYFVDETASLPRIDAGEDRTADTSAKWKRLSESPIDVT